MDNTINSSYMVAIEDFEAALSERLGARRAHEIIVSHDMIEIQAVDHGGAYVDLYLFGMPVGVVNTWDYATGSRMYPHTQEGVRALVSEWIQEDLVDYLGEYA